jgi:hypothetical protein
MSDQPIIVAEKITVQLREGMNVAIYAQPKWTSATAFELAWGCSLLLEGKPVCLKGLLPGVTLHIATRIQQHPGLSSFMHAAWPYALEQIQAWLPSANGEPCLSLSLPYSQALVARFDHVMPPASVHIEWLPMPDHLIYPST